jgi:Domain of unknown function (DUF4333)
MKVFACIAAVVLALSFAACGDDDESSDAVASAPDSSAIESEMKQQLSTDATKVSTAKCPSEIEGDAGATFQCSVSWANGANGKVKVTANGANRFTYEPVPGSVKVPGATIEESLEQELATQGAPDAQANCPDTVIVKLDTTVTCDLSGAGGAAGGTVTYTFSSEDGTVDPSSVETA